MKAVTAAAIVGLLAIGALSAAIILQPGGAPAPATQSEKDRAIIRGAGLEAEPAQNASTNLPPSCLRYISAANACMANQEAITKLAESWQSAADAGMADELEIGCRRAIASARVAYQSICPGVSWD